MSNLLEKIADAPKAKKNLQGSLPKTWGVLYDSPNPDGSTKKCKNCFMWISKENQCEIHDHNIVVTKSHICGFHVYGKPHPKRMHQADGVHLKPVDPKHSGLDEVAAGTHCASCEYYQKIDSSKGTCIVVQQSDGDGNAIGKLAIVEANGCCSRWEHK